MRRFLDRLLPLLLVLILLAECTGAVGIAEDLLYKKQYTTASPFSAPAVTGAVTAYSEMQYQHPDLEQLRVLANTACTLAGEGRDSSAILDSVFAFYDAYDWFYTCYSLAEIRYSTDLSDRFWEREYNYCTSLVTDVEVLLENIYLSLAVSPCRKTLEQDFFGTGFFENFDGESMWDDTIVALTTQENALISQYYSQSSQGSQSLLGRFLSSPDDMAQTMVDLILVRQKIADHLGYDSYEDFANDYYYYRDYDAADMDAYLESIREELVPIYRRVWDLTTDLPGTDTAQTMDFIRIAASNMGGLIADAYKLLSRAGLYDIGFSENKYNSSFEIYLDTYREPFLFMNPELTAYDHLTLAHEFGHFCNDFASSGSQISIDVNEIFSQSMEYLSLCYGPDSGTLTRAKLADSLSTYVEQACYAAFERQMYRIPADQLSIQALYDLCATTARDFGLDAFMPEEFVTITHFFTNPMYITSYIISNDAAMQIYLMELEQPGAGLRCMEENLAEEEAWFLAFLDNAGLESPFAAGRIARVKQFFLDAFGE